MPTGYTHNVQDGTIIELRPFALQCARAFGALILMREAPSDAPIPVRFEPETKYHDEKLASAMARQAELLAMTGGEAALGAESAYAEALKSHAKWVADAALQRSRYQSMMDKVDAWQPPQACAELKAFMLEQLKSSVKFDCHAPGEPPIRQTAGEWHQAETASAGRDIEYHTAERIKEIARTDERNLWIDALRISLA